MTTSIRLLHVTYKLRSGIVDKSTMYLERYITVVTFYAFPLMSGIVFKTRNMNTARMYSVPSWMCVYMADWSLS
jgi:hypothetical protein